MSLQWLWGGQRSVNPTLKGHQLLMVAVATPDDAWLQKIKRKYTDLDVVYVKKNPYSLVVRNHRPSTSCASSVSSLSIVTDDEDEADEIDWSKATVLVSGPLLPAVGQAPKLQLVQLQSAGANVVLDSPLFKDTDVAFSTANGVHGYALSLKNLSFVYTYHRGQPADRGMGYYYIFSKSAPP
jgi:hypothetical protein